MVAGSGEATAEEPGTARTASSGVAIDEPLSIASATPRAQDALTPLLAHCPFHCLFFDRRKIFRRDLLIAVARRSAVARYRSSCAWRVRCWMTRVGDGRPPVRPGPGFIDENRAIASLGQVDEVLVAKITWLSAIGPGMYEKFYRRRCLGPTAPTVPRPPVSTRAVRPAACETSHVPSRREQACQVRGISSAGSGGSLHPRASRFRDGPGGSSR